MRQDESTFRIPLVPNVRFMRLQIRRSGALAMARRCELTNAQWERIASLLPGNAGDPGRTAADNRRFVDGVLWVLRSLPPAKPHRELLQQTQALPSPRNPIRPQNHLLPRLRPTRRNHDLDALNVDST
jgi:Putative transposase of IS4/5 family (DUF4096)